MVFFQLFANHPEIANVPAGHKLFAEGEAGHCMYVLVEGAAEVIVQNRVVEALTVGSMVGEMGLVSPAPRSATVVATRDCKFVAIDEKRFHFLVQETPYFATQVMRLMAERLRTADQMITPAEDI